MKRRMISVICAVLALAGIAVLFVGYRNYSDEQAQISQGYAEISRELSALEADKAAAEKAILSIDEDVAEASGLHPTASIIFRGSSEKIYTEIYPLMKEYGIKGVLTVSKDSVPGGEGLVTGIQLNELVEAGWVIIPEWTEGDGANGIASVEEWAHLSGYILDKAVIVPETACTSDVEKALFEGGYTTVIKNLGAGGGDAVFAGKMEDARTIGAMGYMGSERNTVVMTAVENNGHMTFVVGFADVPELYDKEKFRMMLNYISTHESGIEIMDIAAAVEYRKESEVRFLNAELAAAEQRAEHLSRIEEINEKIASIYKEYGTNGDK